MIDENEQTIEQFKRADSALAAEITDEVRAQLPEEKARATRELAETAEAVRDNKDSFGWVEGLGQPMCSIPTIIHIRWQQLYPGCWKDRQFVDEFLADNPQCCLPGYKPKSKPVYFDMGRVQMSKGASTYHKLKNQVASDADAIRARLAKMGLNVN